MKGRVLGQARRTVSVDAIDAPTAAHPRASFRLAYDDARPHLLRRSHALKPWILGTERAVVNLSLHVEFVRAYVPFNPAWSVI